MLCASSVRVLYSSWHVHLAAEGETLPTDFQDSEVLAQLSPSKGTRTVVGWGGRGEGGLLATGKLVELFCSVGSSDNPPVGLQI